MHIWGLAHGWEWASGCLPTQSSFFFCWALNISFSMMRTGLGLPHPWALGLSHYICGQLLKPWGFTFFIVLMMGRDDGLWEGMMGYGKGWWVMGRDDGLWEGMMSHNAMWDAFASIMKDVVEQTRVLSSPTSNPHVDGLITFCFRLMAFAHWPW